MSEILGDFAWSSCLFLLTKCTAMKWFEWREEEKWCNCYGFFVFKSLQFVRSSFFFLTKLYSSVFANFPYNCSFFSCVLFSFGSSLLLFLFLFHFFQAYSRETEKICLFKKVYGELFVDSWMSFCFCLFVVFFLHVGLLFTLICIGCVRWALMPSQSFFVELDHNLRAFDVGLCWWYEISFVCILPFH